MSKVFIGVGHGGIDPGAVANGVNEKDLNLSIALHCNDVLLRHNVQTLMSRETDENDDLNEEITECNEFSPDLAVDVHNNAGGGDGFEVYYHYKGGTGYNLAKNIETEVIAIGQNSRGCKIKLNDSGTDYFGFIRKTNCPAVLVECAFVDTLADLEIINTEEKRKIMGIALAKGILLTLDIDYIEDVLEDDSQTEDTTNKLYKVQVGAYSLKSNAQNMLEKLEEEGFDGYIKLENSLYKVQVGAYSIKSNAQNMLEKLEDAGFDGYIKVE